MHRSDTNRGRLRVRGAFAQGAFQENPLFNRRGKPRGMKRLFSGGAVAKGADGFCVSKLFVETV